MWGTWDSGQEHNTRSHPTRWHGGFPQTQAHTLPLPALYAPGQGSPRLCPRRPTPGARPAAGESTGGGKQARPPEHGQREHPLAAPRSGEHRKPERPPLWFFHTTFQKQQSPRGRKRAWGCRRLGKAAEGHRTQANTRRAGNDLSACAGGSKKTRSFPNPKCTLECVVR